MQHLNSHYREGDVENEVQTEDLLLRRTENIDVGSLAERRVPELDRSHFDRGHSAIQGVLARTGRIRPPKRRRSGLALSLAEREEISRGVVAGQAVLDRGFQISAIGGSTSQLQWADQIISVLAYLENPRH